MNKYTLVQKSIILSLLLVVAACDSDNNPNDEIATITDRSWLLEEEFSADETLHATRLQTVVLQLEGSDEGGDAIVKNAVRFVVEEEKSHSFCVSELEQHILRIELINSGGDTVIENDRGGACQSVTLEEGHYLLNIYHDGRSVGSDGVLAFLHRPEPLGVSSTPANYYTLPTMDFWVFRGPNGDFVTNASTNSALPLAAISQTVSASEVWRPTAAGRTNGIKYSLTSASNDEIVNFCVEGGDDNTSLSWMFTGTPGDTCQYANGLITKNAEANFIQYNVSLDLFQFDWLLDAQSRNGVLNLDPEEHVKWGTATTDYQAGIFTTEYAGYDCDTACVDDTTLPLATGQIALYKECDYQGPAFVFMADIDDMSIYSSAASAGLGISIDEASSIRLGEDTIARLYSQTDQADTPLVTASDIPCLDETELGNDVLKSFEIIDESAIAYIVSSKGCSNCILTGIDLSKQDFTGYDFTGTVFIGADLTSTTFLNATMDYAELSSVKSTDEVTSLAGTNFDGASMKCTGLSDSDVTSATFEDITITTDFSCHLSLQGATIAYTNFNKAEWRYMDLSDSTMSGLPDSLSTISDPLDLSGVILSNTTWLKGMTLDGVNLGCYALEESQTTVCPASTGTKFCSTLQGTSLVGASLEGACLSQAAMEGAFLTTSNLDGADMSGVQLKAINEGNPATLDGAFMRNVTLTGADITGISANNVNFYTVSGGTADATDVTATGADFSGSYLAFADFSGSTSNLQSTTWSNAMLLGVSFEEADLSTNTSGGVNSGTATKFTGAYMQGTNFSDAILDNVNFTSTYWDTLGSGGALNFLIPKQNLGFNGYWKDISLPECPPDLSYDSGNPPPMNVTNSYNTCPDGGPGPCDTTWGDPVQDISLAFFQSAVSPLFPQDPTASSEDQCSSDFSDPNPFDFCWITTNNPTLCSENALDE